ncbi:phosphatase PAP2 family protein [Variovorax sp. OV329]|uniref:phosphatase PAP2 family protein n=1 Tax=Variovorax sp. OV329 TaxID=1882825 RepID=UPI0008F438A7|nr:phosphatase PAP2 family protein [Variovorax sp. OV329]SFN39266.1 undecaprenyl-diphosphatase [Variovorax sp. OV329]
MNRLFHFDAWMFGLVNAGAGTPMWRIHAATFVSDFLPACLLLALALLALVQPERRRTLWMALLSLCITWLVVRLVREQWPLPRPAALELGIQWVVHNARGGFPSLHASGAFAVAMVLLFERRDRWAALFVSAAAAIAWSRVYLGLHFPTDVLTGAALGSLVALMVLRVSDRRRPPARRARRALP